MERGNNKMISPYIFPGIRHSDLPDDAKSKMRKLISRQSHEITEDLIMETVSSVCKIPSTQIISHRRDRNIVDARCLYIYNVKIFLNKSYVSIGKSLDNRDHTTITFNMKKYYALYKTEEDFKKKADAISKMIEFY